MESASTHSKWTTPGARRFAHRLEWEPHDPIEIGATGMPHILKKTHPYVRVSHGMK